MAIEVALLISGVSAAFGISEIKNEMTNVKNDIKESMERLIYCFKKCRMKKTKTWTKIMRKILSRKALIFINRKGQTYGKV